MTSTKFPWAILAAVVLAAGCAAETADETTEPSTPAANEAPDPGRHYAGWDADDPNYCPTGRFENVNGTWVAIPTACLKPALSDPDPGERKELKTAPGGPDDLRLAPDQLTRTAHTNAL